MTTGSTVSNMIRAGKLRHRVVFQTKVTESNAYNEEVVSRWDDTFWAWAEIDPPKGREYFSAGQKQASVVQRVRIRYRSGVTPAMRIKFGTRIFTIDSVINPDERNRELICMCSEEV